MADRTRTTHKQVLSALEAITVRNLAVDDVNRRAAEAAHTARAAQAAAANPAPQAAPGD
jgi:hypothetical protein